MLPLYPAPCSSILCPVPFSRFLPPCRLIILVRTLPVRVYQHLPATHLDLWPVLNSVSVWWFGKLPSFHIWHEPSVVGQVWSLLPWGVCPTKPIERLANASWTFYGSYVLRQDYTISERHKSATYSQIVVASFFQLSMEPYYLYWGRSIPDAPLSPFLIFIFLHIFHTSSNKF